jgi:hypothetical protein
MLHKHKITVLKDRNLPLQIGRSFVNFKISTPWYDLISCCYKQKLPKKDYQKMNAKRIPIEKEIIIKVQDSFDDDSQESDSQHKLNQIQESNRENDSQKNEIDQNIVVDGEYQNVDSKEDESGKIIVKKKTKGNESKVRKENVRKK